jgi:hypothetical protein
VVCVPVILRCACAGSVNLGRTLHSQHHGGGVVRPRFTESATFGCGWPPFPNTLWTGEAQFGGVPHVPVEPPRCQCAAAWSGARPNCMYAFLWASFAQPVRPQVMKCNLAHRFLVDKRPDSQIDGLKSREVRCCAPLTTPIYDNYLSDSLNFLTCVR